MTEAPIPQPLTEHEAGEVAKDLLHEITVAAVKAPSWVDDSPIIEEAVKFDPTSDEITMASIIRVGDESYALFAHPTSGHDIADLEKKFKFGRVHREGAVYITDEAILATFIGDGLNIAGSLQYVSPDDIESDTVQAQEKCNRLSDDFQKKVETAAEETLHELEEGTTLEDLVDQYREPYGFFTTYMTAPFNESLSIPMIFCFVAPEGTQKGDIAYGGPDTGHIVKSPIGEVRGHDKTYTTTPRQAERIRERIEAHLQSNDPSVEK